MVLFVYSCEDNYTYYEYVDENCLEEKIDNKNTRFIKRSWQDYNETGYCISYKTYDTTYSNCQNSRINFVNNNNWEFYQFWSNLYQSLYDTDNNKIVALLDSLEQIKIRANLDRDNFANVIVSFVQDIPYSYVLTDNNCDSYTDHPCVGNVKFGILSPYEFLHTLYGDCDTRTVLLYTILKHFNYSPCIAVSYKYAHAILLLDVAGTGDYIYEYGRKYYFWETTATGWKAGMLAPDMTNLNYWTIVLK